MNQRLAPEVPFRKEVYAIVKAALEVLRELGHGIHEKPYEKALAVELRLQMLNYLRITHLPVGVILNFRHARLEWERLVSTDDYTEEQACA